VKTDQELKRDVEAELKWSPEIDETDIAVKVNGGTVALSGYARSYFEKYRAEDAVKRVAGVIGVANDVVVRAPSGDGAQDPEITRAAVAAIKVELPVSADKIQVLVHDGRVTLEGKVEWQFQRESAERAVRRIHGVTTVDNRIVIVPQVQPVEVKRKIEDAFRRSAEVDASHITVTAIDGKVTLSGKVRNWSERTQAQNTAWSAPGVREVRNDIVIGT
jgi:osmotically-inducible protein OsmY